MDIKEYESRAKPRLALIDELWGKIQSQRLNESDPVYERYKRLMQEQSADEVAAGL